MHIKKGDIVKVITGKDRAKSGKVLHVYAEENRVLVENVNLMKKKQRPKKQGQKGEMVTVARSLHASNVMLICKSCKQAARVGSRVEGGNKVRYCKKCSVAID